MAKLVNEDPKKKASSKIEPAVPKGLTKDFIKKVDETSILNAKRREVESVAKNDSVSASRVAKFSGSDLIDQRRAGNTAANETRAKGNVPQVMRGRFTNTAPDKYHTGGYSALTSDSYSRTAPLEKEMPRVRSKK